MRGLIFSVGVSVVAAIIVPATASAQTIRPLISEYRSEGRGRFEVVNETDRLLTVVVEPRGFSVSADGEMHDEPLPDGLHLKLSAMSVRLPPRQSRYIFYEVAPDRMPSWFVIYANFTGYPSQSFSGLNVQLELPHIVYVLPKDRWKAADVRVASVEVQAAKRTASVVIENRGSNFGRISTIVMRRAGGPPVEIPGFPLFPGATRRLDVAWDSDTPPDSLLVKTADFSFEHKVVTPTK